MCGAGSYVTYKKAKTKAWEKMMQHHQQQQYLRRQQIQHESTKEIKSNKLETKTDQEEKDMESTMTDTHFQFQSRCLSTCTPPPTTRITTATSIEITGMEDNNESCEVYDVTMENDIICSKSFLCKFLKYIPKEIWNKRRCYFPFATHLVDQATDIGVIIKFYQISEYESENNVNCPNINGTNLFCLSLTAFIFYRVVSCIWIYNITKGKKFDTFLQLFDLKLYHALYINFVLNKQTPSNPQRYLQVLFDI